MEFFNWLHAFAHHWVWAGAFTWVLLAIGIQIGKDSV
jgi:hypothetical protein